MSARRGLPGKLSSWAWVGLGAILGAPFLAFPEDDLGASALAILQRRCVECHGPAKQSGKLRLDSIDALFKGGKSGPSIAAGKRAESLLFERIATDNPRKRMPPKENDPLDARELAVVGEWIDRGARAPAAALATGGEPGATLRPDASQLPVGYAPVFCLAGDPTEQRLAVGRGAAVVIYEVAEPEAAPVKEKNASREGARLRRVSVLRGHDDLVRAVAFSPDSKLLASGDHGKARVWETKSWELLLTLAPQVDSVLALAFSPDSRRLATGGGLPTESGELKVWDLESGKLVWSATPHSDVIYGLGWPQSGPAIVTAGADRLTYLLEATSGRIVRRLEAHTHHVLSVAVSADGKRAGTAGADRRIKVWDLEKGENVRTLRGHDKAATWVGVHGDGSKLASTGADGLVRFWSIDSDNERFAFTEAKGYLQGGCFFGREKWFASAEDAGTLRLYELEKRKLVATIEIDGR